MLAVVRDQNSPPSSQRGRFPPPLSRVAGTLHTGSRKPSGGSASASLHDHSLLVSSYTEPPPRHMCRQQPPKCMYVIWLLEVNTCIQPCAWDTHRHSRLPRALGCGVRICDPETKQCEIFGDFIYHHSTKISYFLGFFSQFLIISQYRNRRQALSRYT